jgi:glycosyltransferase involved in cell wall biosynthesis
MTSAKPRILLLADKRDWAYDFAAQSIRSMLSDEFDFQISYVAENPVAEAKAFNCDLVHVFWWGESWHHCLGLPPERIIKEVSSFRWREEDHFGRIDAPTFVERYLKDAGTIVTTSRKMQDILSPSRPVLYTPNGIHPQQFFLESQRSGDLKIGWAGNVDDACKGIKDIIMPACEDDFQLIVAPGNIRSRDEMRQFYNIVDVFCVASTAEGQPLPLIESLACGCFPVTVDVGIVPEVIRHRDNGLIVGRSVAAFQAAFTWCRSNIDDLRDRASERSAQILASRSWSMLDPWWRSAFRQALATAKGKAAL